MQIDALYHYPVKGLSPQFLEKVLLRAGDYFPGDRLFALENGPSGYDAARPQHLPKTHFLMLARHAALAALKTRFDIETGRLVLSDDNGIVAEGCLHEAAAREKIAGYLNDYLRARALPVQSPVQMLTAAPGFRFTDSKNGFVSLINLASVEAIATAAGAPVDPLRFRGNLYFSGASAWEETQFMGRVLAIGDVRLEVLKMTERCAATSVNPANGDRDLNIVKILQKAFGHVDCGIYARVAEGGDIACGDRLRLI